MEKVSDLKLDENEELMDKLKHGQHYPLNLDLVPCRTDSTGCRPKLTWYLVEPTVLVVGLN